MQLTTLFSLIPIASAITVSYDTGYDNGSRSLSQVACSDGSNGLLTKGYTDQASLPSFPNIGGAFDIEGYNSAACGTCWSLTYGGATINVLAIDVSASGFNIAEEAMNNLTGGQAVHMGRVDAAYVQVNASDCGL